MPFEADDRAVAPEAAGRGQLIIDGFRAAIRRGGTDLGDPIEDAERREFEFALERIRSETYELFEPTGRPITVVGLRAIPSTLFSLDAANDVHIQFKFFDPGVPFPPKPL